MKLTRSCGLGAILLGLAVVSAHAIPITGTVRMGGDVTLNTNNLATATTAVSFSSVQVSAASTGAYTGTGGSAVTWKSFSWAPSNAPINDLWTFTSGLWTYTFDLAQITSVNQSIGSLEVRGRGTADIVGLGSTYETTPVNWSFEITDTSNGTGSATFAFTNSNTAVPDGGSTAILLGSAILGVFAFARRSNRKS